MQVLNQDEQGYFMSNQRTERSYSYKAVTLSIATQKIDFLFIYRCRNMKNILEKDEPLLAICVVNDIHAFA